MRRRRIETVRGERCSTDEASEGVITWNIQSEVVRGSRATSGNVMLLRRLEVTMKDSVQNDSETLCQLLQ